MRSACYDHPPPRDGIPSALAVALGGIAIVLAYVLFSAATGLGAELPVDVKTRARVALALAEAECAAKDAVATPVPPDRPAVAPMPRPATAKPKSPKLTYSDGYRRASLDQTPLVIYVGCDGPRVDGSIASKVESFGDVRPPAVLVGYPLGRTLYIDATLRGGEATTDAVVKAVAAAAKKIEVPAKEMPGRVAPPPLDYQIRGGVSSMKAPCCVCGPGCRCPVGACPSRCPVLANPAVVTHAGGTSSFPTTSTPATSPACPPSG